MFDNTGQEEKRHQSEKNKNEDGRSGTTNQVFIAIAEGPTVGIVREVTSAIIAVVALVVVVVAEIAVAVEVGNKL